MAKRKVVKEKIKNFFNKIKVALGIKERINIEMRKFLKRLIRKLKKLKNSTKNKKYRKIIRKFRTKMKKKIRKERKNKFELHRIFGQIKTFLRRWSKVVLKIKISLKINI